MELEEVKKRVEEAVHLLYEKDKYLLEFDSSERSITHRLGLYLQDLFKDWDVDCEYNRYGHDPKNLPSSVPISGKRRVYPDIIIHRRGFEGPNLLVIEAKKSRRLDKGQDLKKLRGYKQTLNYVFAAFLEVSTGKKCEVPSVSWH